MQRSAFRLVVIAIALVCTSLWGCTRETARRTVYDTLQNVGQQQCDRDRSADCPERQSYEQYQRERTPGSH